MGAGFEGFGVVGFRVEGFRVSRSGFSEPPSAAPAEKLGTTPMLRLIVWDWGCVYTQSSIVDSTFKQQVGSERGVVPQQYSLVIPRPRYITRHDFTFDEAC